MRGLLADGRRKSMAPMAERLGIDHQRLQQFITSSTWDYAAVLLPGEDARLASTTFDQWLAVGAE